jgi:hypothetical protein
MSALPYLAVIAATITGPTWLLDGKSQVVYMWCATKTQKCVIDITANASFTLELAHTRTTEVYHNITEFHAARTGDIDSTIRLTNPQNTTMLYTIARTAINVSDDVPIDWNIYAGLLLLALCGLIVSLLMCYLIIRARVSQRPHLSASVRWCFRIPDVVPIVGGAVRPMTNRSASPAAISPPPHTAAQEFDGIDVQPPRVADAAPMLPMPPVPAGNGGALAAPAAVLECHSMKPLRLQCAICMMAEACVLFRPCRHLCSCEGCAVRIDKCPICRATIRGKENIFIV